MVSYYSYDERILNSLPPVLRSEFPARIRNSRAVGISYNNDRWKEGDAGVAGTEDGADVEDDDDTELIATHAVSRILAQVLKLDLIVQFLDPGVVPCRAAP